MPLTREAYQKKMENQLKAWSERITSLEAKAEKAGADLKKDLLTELKSFKELDASGKEHLKNLEAVAADSWDQVKVEVNDKWNRVAGAADAIWARVK
jgi:hypothetical protein